MNEQVIQINVPEDADNIVVFVHGFGVRYDSRGMFLDIKNSLPSSWGSVLFDFNKVEGQNVYITNLDDQVTKLLSIVDDVEKNYPSATIHIIAHSQGCIVTALSNTITNGSVIMLAPPETMGKRIKDFFMQQPGVTSTDSELIIPRKDGTTTYLPHGYFSQHKLAAAEQQILNYSYNQKIKLLQTTEDEVLGKTEYSKLKESKNVTLKELDSDHNFSGDSRTALLKYIKRSLRYE